MLFIVMNRVDLQLDGRIQRKLKSFNYNFFNESASDYWDARMEPHRFFEATF